MNNETRPPARHEVDPLTEAGNEHEAKTLAKLNYAYGFIGGCAWDLDTEERSELIGCLDRVFELLRLDARNAKCEAARERDSESGEAA